MVNCFAPACSHTSERESCRFFAFPTEKKQLKKWINYIRRADREPSKYSRICSCHFVDNKRENGPTIFPRNVEKRFCFTSPTKKKPRLQSSVPEPMLLVPEVSTVPGSLLPVPEPSSPVPEPPLPVPGPSLLVAGPSSIVPGTSMSTCTDAENYFLKQEVVELRKALESSKDIFSYRKICKIDKLVRFYTGLPTAEIFNLVMSLCEDFEINYYSGWEVKKIPREDQLFITLMKLRLNLKRLDLSTRFGCSEGTITNIILTWLHVLHNVVYKALMSEVPSQTKNKCCLPHSFKDFSNCRMVLDATEIFTNLPKSMMEQKAVFSHYKHHSTFKALVGVAPNGVITYVSELYPGKCSDKQLVQLSGVMDIFEAGDLIIADKGFLINDILPPGVSLNIPPFLSTPQFTPSQVLKTNNIARARVHVERAIRRVKSFDVLNKIPHYMFPFSTIVWQICAALTNFQYPLIKDIEKFYEVD